MRLGPCVLGDTGVMKWLGTWWKVDDGRRVVGDLVEDKAGL